MAHYRGATEQELREAGGIDRFLASLAPGRLLPHTGAIRLEGGALVLEGWMTLHRHEITGIDLDFDANFGRWQAGGIGPEGPLPGLFKSGKPIVVRRKDGTTCYLVIDRQPITGATQNQAWYGRLQDWMRSS